MDARGHHGGESQDTEPLITSSDDLSELHRLQLAQVRERWLVRKLGFSFFLFGLINNVLYVIILSAALDLVPPSTPKGIIAFCNIAPSLAVKVGWPYLLKGRIRYTKRVIGCCLLSVCGIVVVALFQGLYMRLLGIALASFSSGLGEMTFLQLSTTYSPPVLAGRSVGYFASGTGAAGLVGAFLWWEVRGLGVRTGLGLSSIMPFITPLAYFFLLPRSVDFAEFDTLQEDLDEGNGPTTISYAPLPSTDNDAEGRPLDESLLKTHVALTMQDKLRLVKPLLLKYMLPLFCVYLFEYTINQGVAPTLLYPVPSTESSPILSKIIHSVRDYYPLWQLVYQTTVFFSRSSITIGLPPLPQSLLPLPAILQGLILITLVFESAVGFFSPSSPTASILIVFLLISVEGICGGLAYVNVFYRINQERSDSGNISTSGVTARSGEGGTSGHDDAGAERQRQEREFKIGSIGFSDSSGILIASLLAVPTELELCKAQVARGKMLCRGL